MKKNIVILSLFAIIGLFVSCYAPSPLYGTWSDNAGNKISFMQDRTFSGKIINNGGKADTIQGNYTVIDNVIIFNVVGEETSYTRNTEWDIRGAMLYITWTTDNTPVNLTLYHTAR